jgi:glucokinase
VSLEPHDDKLVLGVDIGGTKTAVCAATAAGRIMDRHEFATTGPQETQERIVAGARELAAEYAAIGISCGGPLDSDRGMVLSPPNLPGWDQVAIVSHLASSFGAPAWLENDANAGALAEWRFGAGKGCNSLVFLTCGTGMGAGLIVDGRLCRGARGLAGEVGHIRLAEDGPVGHNKAGSFEGFCSGGGIAALARIMLGRPHAPSALDRTKHDELTTRAISDAARAGDRLAQDVIAKSGTYLGRALAVIIDILNPELVVLGPLSWRLGGAWLAAATAALREEALSESLEDCRIEPAQLGERVGDYAAVCVALNGMGC